MKKERRSTNNCKVVVVSGYFDPLHRGHCEHMKKAKELGDVLVVIAGSDEQIKRKYGYVLKPLHKRVERIIRKAPFVQGVVVSIDNNNEAATTLRMIRPDVYAKGGDRTEGSIPQSEIDICNEIGCRIVYGVQGVVRSSNKIRQRIERWGR